MTGTVWALFWIPTMWEPKKKTLESLHNTLGGARKAKNKLEKERDSWQHPHSDFKISKYAVGD